MSISVQCPACRKKLKARDDLAGKRVKCPACGQPVLVSALQPAAVVEPPRTAAQLFVEAVVAGNLAEVARLLPQVEFTVAEAPDDSDDDGKAALLVEVDDVPAMVAFTSNEHAQAFAESGCVQLDDDDSMPAFVVSGEDLLADLPEAFGLLLNPESEDCIVLTPEQIGQIRSAGGQSDAPQLDRSVPADADPAAEALRNSVLEFLESGGFRPARWLPMPELERTLRPAEEIAARLMGLAAVFTWASAPDEAVSSDKLLQYIEDNRLRDALTDDEAGVIALSRDQARDEHAGNIGWRLENMWPLAWILGFGHEPDLAAAQIDQSISRELLFEFLGGLDGSIEQLLETSQLQSDSDVNRLEDLFYCAHNAVRSAQLGESTVPEGFHPVIHGGAVHERRHSLTWSLSPGVQWDDTDLST